MRFRADHRFEGPVGAVAAVLTDPDFYVGLELPDLSRPELVGQGSDGSGAFLALRYQFLGHLDPLAKRLVGGRELAWTQELQLEASKRSGRLLFEADGAANLLHGEATFTLEEAEDGAAVTVRRLEGDLTVALPGIGGMAERRIVPGVLKRLDLEAAAVNRRLQAASEAP